MTPIEKAQRQNKQLMVAYKNRMEKIGGNRSNKANMSLSLQRKLAENMAIAKARQHALGKSTLTMEKEYYCMELCHFPYIITIILFSINRHC